MDAVMWTILLVCRFLNDVMIMTVLLMHDLDYLIVSETDELTSSAHRNTGCRLLSSTTVWFSETLYKCPLSKCVNECAVQNRVYIFCTIL